MDLGGIYLLNDIGHLFYSMMLYIYIERALKSSDTTIDLLEASETCITIMLCSSSVFWKAQKGSHSMWQCSFVCVFYQPIITFVISSHLSFFSLTDSLHIQPFKGYHSICVLLGFKSSCCYTTLCSWYIYVYITNSFKSFFSIML